jgi:hypothetical protein
MFPWRQLGALLADEGLLTPTELELALDEQRRTGRLLGQIVVDRGYVSAFSLARVLSAQHGVDLHQPQQPEPEPHLTAVPKEWRPLGHVLLDQGLVTKSQLADALLSQTPDKRLGELLVERDIISGADLARALSEQHGLAPDSLADDLGAELKPAPPREPVFRVYNVTFLRGFQERTSVWESANFLEAADFAMEFVQDHSPDALEIERVNGVEQETVWAYSESRAAAESLARKDLVDTFGFDPTKWGKQL